MNVKPVNCGCGGKIEKHHMPISGKVFFRCRSCGIETKFYDTEEEATIAWNRAMGADNVCRVCKMYISVDDGDGYCTFDDEYRTSPEYGCRLFERIGNKG